MVRPAQEADRPELVFVVDLNKLCSPLRAQLGWMEDVCRCLRPPRRQSGAKRFNNRERRTHTRRLQVHSLDWAKRGGGREGGENQFDYPKSRLQPSSPSTAAPRRRSTFLSPSVSQSSLSLEASQLTATAAAVCVCLVIWRRDGERGRGAAKMSH